jgi:hypothetical protein
VIYLTKYIAISIIPQSSTTSYLSISRIIHKEPIPFVKEPMGRPMAPACPVVFTAKRVAIEGAWSDLSRLMEEVKRSVKKESMRA